MIPLQQCYEAACRQPSDINQHCATLARYAAQCASVTEAGVRSAVSSWALLWGLAQSTAAAKTHTGIDIHNHANISRVAAAAKQIGVEYRFLQGNDLQVPLEPTDLFFIDTWHVYGQLKRELARFAPLTRRFLIMHDTEVDAERGESIRCRHDVAKQVQASGFPRNEIVKGLRPALDEFLAANKQWRLAEHFKNNNGLTILERVASDGDSLD
jgi:hypothetical protein